MGCGATNDDDDDDNYEIPLSYYGSIPVPNMRLHNFHLSRLVINSIPAESGAFFVLIMFWKHLNIVFIHYIPVSVINNFHLHITFPRKSFCNDNIVISLVTRGYRG